MASGPSTNLRVFLSAYLKCYETFLLLDVRTTTFYHRLKPHNIYERIMIISPQTNTPSCFVLLSLEVL